MKVRVILTVADRSVDETLVGADADSILAQAKERVERELGWKGFFLKAISPLMFAQEAVRRYNGAYNCRYQIPQSAEEFFRLGQDLGIIQILPDAEDSQAPASYTRSVFDGQR
jgi:hypothetical protein